MFNTSFWRHQPSLTHPELEDDYLFAQDEDSDDEQHWPDEDDRCDPALE